CVLFRSQPLPVQRRVHPKRKRQVIRGPHRVDVEGDAPFPGPPGHVQDRHQAGPLEGAAPPLDLKPPPEVSERAAHHLEVAARLQLAPGPRHPHGTRDLGVEQRARPAAQRGRLEAEIQGHSGSRSRPLVPAPPARAGSWNRSTSPCATRAAAVRFSPSTGPASAAWKSTSAVEPKRAKRRPFPSDRRSKRQRPSSAARAPPHSVTLPPHRAMDEGTSSTRSPRNAAARCTS